MSIDTVSEVSDYSDATYLGNEFSLSNMPFSSWLVIQFVRSSFFPSDFTLRPIEDKGSISDSLTAAHIDIFDRIPVENSLFLTMMRAVGIFARGFFSPLFSLTGVFYHGYITAKYLVQWLIGGEETDHNWEKASQHANKLLFDLIYTALPIFGGWYVSALTGFGKGVAILSGAIVSAVVFTMVVHEPLVIATFSDMEHDLYGFYKSIILRKEFGLVNSKTGGLLTWDPIKDQDVSISWGLYSFTEYFELKGYFGNMHLKQGEEFLDLIRELQEILPQDCKYEFSYPPGAAKIAEFLNENRTHLKFDIEEWKQKFYTLDANLKLIRDLIAHGYTLAKSTSYLQKTLDLDFPLAAEDCLSYLKEVAT